MLNLIMYFNLKILANRFKKYIIFRNIVQSLPVEAIAPVLCRQQILDYKWRKLHQPERKKNSFHLYATFLKHDSFIVVFLKKTYLPRYKQG